MEKKNNEIREIGNDKGENEAGNVSDDELTKMSEKDADPHPPDPKYQIKYVPGRGIERYNKSLKSLIPFRRKGRDEGTMPIDSIGLFSYVSMSWLSKFIYKGYKKGLKMEELPTISPYDTCDYNADRLELLWKNELAKMGPEKASFSKVVRRFCQTAVIAATIIQIIGLAIAIISNTIFMRWLLQYLQSGNGSYEEGMKWALLFTAGQSSRVLFVIWSRLLNDRTALRLRSACMTLVYRKLIRVNNLGDKSIGEVINVFTTDAQRIFEMLCLGVFIIEAPISMMYGVFYILYLFSPIALLGIIAFLVFFTCQYLLSRLIRYLEIRRVKISDLRVRLMNEILECVKLIKMYAWEKRFSNDLMSARKKERQMILKSSYLQSLNSSLASSVPIISAVITFLAHVTGGNSLTAAQVFPYISFLDSRFRISLISFVSGLNSIVSAGISIDRVQGLLLLEDGESSTLKPTLKSQAVTISHGTFAYNNFRDLKLKKSNKNVHKRKSESKSLEGQNEEQKLNKPTDNADHIDVLFDVSFEAEKGKLIGICGTVGSGKSSLLLAVLGQLRVSEGQVMRDGSCAYVSQQAWISNATLRENILFGAKFDRSRYDKTVYACNLSQDIDMMPGGDQTEIGEKGVNLSGGQKQRVALARALYADRDIYLLDDPLSAVDSRVGAYIFDNLILGALREKTVLFVTHQIQYLNHCDYIYVLHNGKIVEHGTYDDLTKLGNEYALMAIATSTNYENSEDQKIEDLSQSVNGIPHPKEKQTRTTADTVEKSKTPATASLTVAENLQQGTVKASTYHSYIIAAGGYCSVFIMTLIFLISMASPALSSWWLAIWIQAGSGNTTIVRNNATILSDNINDNPDFNYYRTIYGCTLVMILLTNTIRSLVFSQFTIKASTKLHNDLYKKVVESPMRFCDTTPSGRIQHLFSRDMDDVDSRLPNALRTAMQTIMRLSLIGLVICLVLPWFILPMCVITLIYYMASKRFSIAIKAFKRMDNKSRAPVISFVKETVQGLSTIHAFGKENDFMRRFTNLFDENSKYLYMCNTAVSWLVVRIDVLATMMIAITTFLVVAFQKQVSPAFAGLVLSLSSQISNTLPFTMKLLSEAQILFICVERIDHYIKTLKSEESTDQRIVEPPKTWPQTAEIKFKNVNVAYGEGDPVILKNVSFTVHAGEKIGIVGRTGAGKSSLTVALFRLVELAEGKIEIDDVDISEISLNQLRTKLSIIPQDPVLFSGTIRSNLDPFKLYTDVEIWEALEKTELKNKVRLIPGQLDASVGSGGDNMSVGERQLLCLSRALLRNSKILILDEATAAVDPETEIAVQNTVQREFANCTILTIAHRLQTVLSLSRILVMDDGKVLEFDTPSNLLGDPSSEFSKMMAAANQSESR